MRSSSRQSTAVALLVLASCGEQQVANNAAQAQLNTVAVTPAFSNELAARLGKGDPTLCTDETVQRLVISQTLAQVDEASAEKYQLLLTSGGSLDLAGARMVEADQETGEVTCSATLPKGYSEQPVQFTYVLRPDADNSGLVVGPEGQVGRWFHIRGAVMLKLAEMGLIDRQPLTLPNPIETEPAPLPSSDTDEALGNDDAVQPELLPVPPVSEWNGVDVKPV